jgi:predicted Holliday junction resolvase-like endonuclease
VFSEEVSVMSSKEVLLEEEKKSFNIFSDAIIAVLIPIAGYYTAFRYETGYARYFGIPATFIEVGLSEVLGLVGLLLILFFMTIGYMDIRAKFYKGKNPINRAIGRVLFPILVLSLLIYASDLRGLNLYTILFFMFVILFVEFILPLFSQRKIKGYKNKLEQQEQKDEMSKSRMSSWLRSYSKGRGIFKYAAIVLIVFSLFFMDSVGGAHARHQTSFLILKSNPELVVLRKYSGKLICAEFDRGKREILNAFYIKSLDQVAKRRIKIVTEVMGPLRRHKKD